MFWIKEIHESMVSGATGMQGIPSLTAYMCVQWDTPFILCIGAQIFF